MSVRASCSINPGDTAYLIIISKSDRGAPWLFRDREYSMRNFLQSGAGNCSDNREKAVALFLELNPGTIQLTHNRVLDKGKIICVAGYTNTKGAMMAITAPQDIQALKSGNRTADLADINCLVMVRQMTDGRVVIYDITELDVMITCVGKNADPLHVSWDSINRISGRTIVMSPDDIEIQGRN